MTLPGHYMSSAALVRIYGATNGAPAHKDKPLLSSNINQVMGPDGTQKQEDCAGEDQQQFTKLDWTGLKLLSHGYEVMSLSWESVVSQ
jgi:hypothetical protein